MSFGGRKRADGEAGVRRVEEPGEARGSSGSGRGDANGAAFGKERAYALRMTNYFADFSRPPLSLTLLIMF